MKFKVKLFPIKTEKYSVIMNQNDADELGLLEGDRVKVIYNSRQSFIASVQLAAVEMIEKGEVGLASCIGERCEISDDFEVKIVPVPKPKSVEYIKKKLDGGKFSKDEIYAIIKDIVDNALNEVEMTAFVLSSYLKGMDFDEIEWMTRAMIETGETLSFERGIVVDKHSIGGVPGNKISLLIVPTIAAAGLLIPKTASRAITSASGTADTMEVFAEVNLNMDEIKEITERVGGVIAWGGATEIAPADDKIIHVEYPLAIDPKPQLLASVMAKKGAIGARYAVIDIPTGEGSKVPNVEKGRELANDFVEMGRRLGLNITCALTYGGQPVGRAVGPALEAWEALKAMEERKGSASLLEKALGIAGILLEMTGKATNGYAYARELFESGKTLEKFMEIVEAQGGEKIKSDDIPIGDKTYKIKSNFEGAVVGVNNLRIVKIARAAGAPKDKGAGIYIHKKKGEIVNVGDDLVTIYAEKDWKLDNAIEVAQKEPPILVSGMILEKYPSYRYV